MRMKVKEQENKENKSTMRSTHSSAARGTYARVVPGGAHAPNDAIALSSYDELHSAAALRTYAWSG